MAAPSLPVRGRRFYHRHIIDTDLNPSLFQVTRVAQGQVYYAMFDEFAPKTMLKAPLKASLRSQMDYFLLHALGYWADEALHAPTTPARSLRRFAKATGLREALPLSERARAVASYLHALDLDKAGTPYMQHIQSVADGVQSEDEKVVAYLHDTKEDHGLSDLDFEWLGFSSEHIAGINGVTKLKSERGETGYHEFVVRASLHPLSRAVKLSDLRDNSNLERIPLPLRTDRDAKRVEKYQREIAFLESLPAFNGPELD